MKKILEFIKKWHLPIIVVLYVLFLIRGCQLSNRTNRIVKNTTEFEHIEDSLKNVIIEKENTIRDLNTQITNLQSKLSIYVEQVNDLKTDKNMLRKVNIDNAKTIKNMTNENNQ